MNFFELLGALLVFVLISAGIISLVFLKIKKIKDSKEEKKLELKE